MSEENNTVKVPYIVSYLFPGSVKTIWIEYLGATAGYDAVVGEIKMIEMRCGSLEKV